MPVVLPHLIPVARKAPCMARFIQYLNDMCSAIRSGGLDISGSLSVNSLSCTAPMSVPALLNLAYPMDMSEDMDQCPANASPEWILAFPFANP